MTTANELAREVANAIYQNVDLDEMTLDEIQAIILRETRLEALVAVANAAKAYSEDRNNRTFLKMWDALLKLENGK